MLLANQTNIALRSNNTFLFGTRSGENINVFSNLNIPVNINS